MKKEIAILIMALLILVPLMQDVSATKTVFITSDNIIDHDTDIEMLNSIKNYIEEISGGELQVIIDNQAPGPGEGWRAINVTSDICISLAAADAGNYLQLATSTVYTDKQIILINTGSYDLDNHTNYLRRAWDDNYSNESLAGIRDPGTFLKNAGIYYLQPTKEFPDNAHDGYLDRYDEEMNRQILYLLAVGRFYTYDLSSGQDQTNTAMQGLLSSTLSGQINNILSNAIGSKDWNFGTTFSTGQLGWQDMDVEGSLSGRLLNNRLLINGTFGYRDTPVSNTNFIGDFDVRYLLTPSGTVSLKAYSETNDRYFTKSALTTQGIGIQLKKDFNSLGELFRRRR